MSLINPIIKQDKSRKRLAITNGIDLKAIYMLISFLIIHKKHFKDIFYYSFKLKNVLKLLTSFIIIKSWINYIKLENSIKLAIYGDNFLTDEEKSITQLL